jgi:hypothetical protein
MKKVFLALFGVFTLLQVSCIDLDMDDIDELIRLDRHEIVFTAHDRSSADLRTVNRHWWIVEAKTNGETYRPDYGSLHSIDHDDYITLYADWLTIERTGAKTLSLEVKSNATGYRREATVILKSAGGFEYINVTQYPD